MQCYYSIRGTCISLIEVDGGCSSVLSAMVLELVNREEALVLGDVKLLIGEEPVVVLGGHLSKRPDKGHVLVLDVVIGSRITYVVWSRVCVIMSVYYYA